MSTINHKIEELNQEGTGYDTYHPETNANQVYDFRRSKWLSEVLNDIDKKLSTMSYGEQVSDLTEKNDLVMESITSIEELIIAIQNQLASKYSKPTNGIPLEDLEAIIRESIDKVPQIESSLALKYSKPSNGIPLEDLEVTVRDSLEKADKVPQIESDLSSKYSKPTNGIPLEDLEMTVKTSLEKADKVTQIESDLSVINDLITELKDSKNNKVEAYKYELIATMDNQRGFDIYDVFDPITDTLIDVSQNGSSLGASRYNTENGNIYLSESVSIGTVISFTILKNIPLMEQQPQKFQLIKGDLMTGYYGKVDGLITGDELIEKIGFTAGTTIVSEDITWLKFSHNYKTLLIADRAVKHFISWNDVNAQNLVKGKAIEIDGQYYLCRLMTGGRSNPAHSGAGDGGEWTNLIMEFTPNDNDSHWDKNNNAGAFSLCQEMTSDITRRVARGGNSLYTYTSYAVDNSGMTSSVNVGYRPVLELL